MLSDPPPPAQQPSRDRFDLAWASFVGLLYLAATFALFHFGASPVYGITEPIDTAYALAIVSQSCPLLVAIAGVLIADPLDRLLTVLTDVRGRTPAGAVAVVIAAIVLAALFTAATAFAFWAAGMGRDAGPAWRAQTDVWIGFGADAMLVLVFVQFLHALTRRWLVTAILFATYAGAVIVAAGSMDVKLVGFGSTPDLLLTFGSRHAVGIDAAWLYREYWSLVALAMLALLAGFDERPRPLLKELKDAKPRGLRAGSGFIAVLGFVVAAGLLGSDLRRDAADIDHAYDARPASNSAVAIDVDRRPTAVAGDIVVDARSRPASVRVDGRILLRNNSGMPLRVLLFEKAPVLRIVAARLDTASPADVERSARVLKVRLARPLAPGAGVVLHYRGLIAPVNRLDLLARSVVWSDGFLLTTPMLMPAPRTAACLDEADGSRCVGENYQLSDPMRGAISVRVPAGATVASAGLGEGGYRGSWWQAAIRPDTLSNVLVAGGRFRVASVSDAATGETRTAYAAPYSNVSPTCLARYATGEISAYSSAWRRLSPATFHLIETPAHLNLTQAFRNGVAVSERYLRAAHGRQCIAEGTQLVVAHEVAHQWWGYWIVPTKRPGAPIVLESFAQAAALARMEQRGVLSRSRIIGMFKAFTAQSGRAGGARKSLRTVTEADERAYLEGPAALLGGGREIDHVLPVLRAVLWQQPNHNPASTDPSVTIDALLRAAPPRYRNQLRRSLR